VVYLEHDLFRKPVSTFRDHALMATLTLGEAESLVARALIRCRTSEANALCVARALVAAEADGLKGHGLSRDAATGFAYPAIEAALARLPAMAREAGVVTAAIRRSHHCGAAGHPVERLAAQGLVALMFANTPAAIAPWGGAKAVFGTNPIAFACPLPDRAPLVVDLALSKVARGNILAAKQKGEKIPRGWALDAQGEPTTDPDAALAGTMLPLGDAKGTPLLLMVELLAAGLTGANFAAEASSFLDDKGPPPGTGQLIIAFDPIAFGGTGEHVAHLIASIETQPGTRLPGSRRLAARRKAASDGLVLSDALINEIESL